jgi:uncharacterized membrane protein YhaH (DUF805 family)
MKFDKILWGLFLILAGVLWVLNNLGIIVINFRDLIKLWPVVLIFWGISVLPIKEKIKIFFASLLILISIFVMISLGQKKEAEQKNDIEFFEDV